MKQYNFKLLLTNIQSTSPNVSNVTLQTLTELNITITWLKNIELLPGGIQHSGDRIQNTCDE